MSTRWARVARGFIAALFSTFVAVCSHILAGGSAPSLVGLALCLAFSTVLCTLLAGTSLSLLRLSASVALSQFAFHGAFSLLTDAAPGSTPTMPSMDPHYGGEMIVHIDALSPTTTATMTTDAQMWLCHAVAAIVTIVAFRFGELAFWGLIELTRLCISGLCITRLVATAPPIQATASVPPNVVAAERAQLPRTVEQVISALRHRGPPAFRLA